MPALCLIVKNALVLDWCSFTLLQGRQQIVARSGKAEREAHTSVQLHSDWGKTSEPQRVNISCCFYWNCCFLYESKFWVILIIKISPTSWDYMLSFMLASAQSSMNPTGSTESTGHKHCGPVIYHGIWKSNPIPIFFLINGFNELIWLNAST